MDIANSSETHGTKEVARGTPDETSDETSLDSSFRRGDKIMGA